ncbi:XdhC family protein [Oryzihumus leptocrescens]
MTVARTDGAAYRQVGAACTIRASRTTLGSLAG